MFIESYRRYLDNVIELTNISSVKRWASMVTQMWPETTPGDHNVNKLESTLLKDASTHITAFWPISLNVRKF